MLNYFNHKIITSWLTTLIKDIKVLFTILVFKEKILKSKELEVMENNLFSFVFETNFQNIKNEKYFKKFIGDRYKLYNFYFILLNNEVSKKIFLTSHYENNEFYIIKFIKKYFKEINFIDVGSHMGFYSLFVSKLYKDTSKVLSIECNQKLLNYQKKLLELNNLNLKNIYFENLLISDKNNYFFNNFYDGLTSTSNNNLETSKLDYSKKEMNSTGNISSILKKYNFEKIDFIKLDIEGEELFYVIENIETIKQKKPIIQFEINILLYDTVKINNIIEFFSEIEYEIFQIGFNKSNKEISLVKVDSSEQIDISQNVIVLCKNNETHQNIKKNLS